MAKRDEEMLAYAEEQARMMSMRFLTLTFYVMVKPGRKPRVTAMEFSRQLYMSEGFEVRARYRKGIRIGGAD